MTTARWFTLSLACLLIASSGTSAAEYFVAPDGLDTNPGTKEAPFASIQHAETAAEPGDTVYLRGGTYRMQESDIARKRRIWAYVIHLRKSGQEGQPIRYFAYENERPVFDFSAVKPEGHRVHAFQVEGSWLHLKGIEVVGVQVTMTGHTQSICFASEGRHNIFEQLSMHDGMAIGIYVVRGGDCLYLNCDAYNNHDPVSQGGRGGNVDGFGCHPFPGAKNNVFRGCRAWFNADDGYDCISASEAVRFENCWAMWNGYSSEFEARADGNGFKAGGYGISPRPKVPQEIPRHVIQQCVSVGNKNSGFYANHHPGGCDWLNNTAYRNGANFNMLNRATDFQKDVPGFGHVLKNNLAYGGRRALVNIDESKCTLEANAFDTDIKATKEDFVELKDNQQLTAARQADGSLPEMTILQLAPQSKLIDAGVDVGLPFAGKAPDIGAFESEN